MKARKMLKNESGMGLLQMLILIGVSTALIAGVVSSIINMFRSQQTASQALEADLFSDQLVQVLGSDSVCTGSFGAASFSPDLSGAEQNVPAFVVPTSMGNVTMAAGTAISENLEIAKVTHRIDTSIAAQTLVMGASTVRHYQSILSVQLKKRNTNSFVQSLQPYAIKMHVITDAGNQIVGCSAVTAGSLACAAEGGAWNPLAPNGQKCVALAYCQYGGSWAEAADADGGFINTFTHDRSCPAGFAPQQSGTINKAQSGGKYKVTNSQSRIFTCMLCGSQLAAQTAAVPPTGPVDMSGFNGDAYEAVAETDANNYNLALADTELAYKAWQDGVALSSQLQGLIDQSNTNKSNAQNNASNAQNDYNNYSNAYNSAVGAYNSAASAYGSDPSPANAQAVADTQNNMNAQASNRDNASSSISYWNSQATQANNDINAYTSQKNSTDANNNQLYQNYLAAKAISDNLHNIALASAAAAAAGQEPAY